MFVIFPDILKFSGPELLFLQLGLLRFAQGKGIIGTWATVGASNHVRLRGLDVMQICLGTACDRRWILNRRGLGGILGLLVVWAFLTQGACSQEIH
ncbi:MAG: hypothetical protein ACYS0H_11850, partial [Planctomycetota bacterium]